MGNEFEAEIEAVHQFLTAWLSGCLPRSADAFAPFAEVLADDFVIIAPEGVWTERTALLAGLEAAHGARGSDFVIAIANPRLRSADTETCLGTYEEWQSGAAPTTARLSTVLFRRRDDRRNGLEWLHLHETWMPGHAPAG